MKRRFSLDTGIAELWLRADTKVRLRAAQAETAGGVIGIGTPVLGELRAGYERSNSRTRNMKRLERELSQLVLWSYEMSAANEYGRLQALLLNIGRPMQSIDVQTAAIAFALGRTTVVSMDSDFSAIPGLTVEDWSQ